MLPANANTFPAPKDSQQNSSARALPEAQPEDADLHEEEYQVPIGPLAWKAQYSLDPVEELRWLKMQVSDIARVCSAVSRGDFTHKIHAREESVVMVQLRDVINGMVSLLRA